MSRKTRSTCKQLESVISSLEALEAHEHDAVYVVVHKAMTVVKDKLCQEIYNAFLKCIFSEVEEAKQAVIVAEQAVQEAVTVSNAAFDTVCERAFEGIEENLDVNEALNLALDVDYADEGFRETERNIKVAREALKVAEKVLEDKKKVLTSVLI